MQRSLKLIGMYALPTLMVSCLFWVYFSTMAPGLSWANGGSDGGDLIAAAATGGIAHPTGYPVYLLLARLFQALPIGSLAFRTNLLSGMAMAGASYWIYATVDRLAQNSSPHHKRLAGVIAGLAFGTSPIAWSQAVITEVYALHAFFVALTLYLISDPLLAIQRDRKVFVIGLVLGLALGNHVTMTLLVPPIIILISIGRRRLIGDLVIFSTGKWQLMWKDLIRLITGMGLTLSSYLLLPLWARDHPPVNWGNPITLRSFLWLVTGKLYQDQLVTPTQWNILERLQDWANLLLQQFGTPGLVLAVIGLVVMFIPNRIYIMTLWTAVSVSVFALSYRAVDWHIHLIPFYVVFGIWIGFGSSKIMELFSAHGRAWGYAIGLVFIVYLVGIAIPTWNQVDASENMWAEGFGREMMDGLPEHAIVFADEDRALFTLWYFHYALHDRPDIFVLATDLLPFDWYRETLRITYPNLNIPSPPPDIWQDGIVEINSTHPVCYPYYSEITMLNCR